MEKFSKFTDETVGVNGFVQQPYKPSFCSRFTGLLWLGIRLPLFLILGTIVYAVEILINICSGITPLTSLLRIVFERPLVRALLFCLGFHRINGIYSPHKQSIRLRSSASRPTHAIKNNDILLVNHSSYIDILYLVYAYSPLFVIRNNEGKLITVPFLQAISFYRSQTFYSTVSPLEKNTNQKDKITETSVKELLNREYSSPLVIFPEQAPSNNKVILSFPSFIQSIGDASSIDNTNAVGNDKSNNKRQRRFHILGLKYDDVHTNGTKQFGTGQNPGKLDLSSSSLLSPCLVTGSIIYHGLSLMMQSSNRLSIWQLPVGYDPQPLDYSVNGTSDNSSRASTNPTIGAGADRIPLANGILSTSSAPTATTSNGTVVANTWSTSVRQAFATLLNVTPVRQDYRSHADFVCAYSENLLLKKIN